MLEQLTVQVEMVVLVFHLAAVPVVVVSAVVVFVNSHIL